MKKKKFGFFAAIVLAGFFSWFLVACGGANDPRPPTEYHINIGQVTGGAVDADRTTAPAGAVVTLTLTPNAEHLFGEINVVGTGSDTAVDLERGYDNYEWTFRMPAESVTVTAVFVQMMYDITLTYIGPGTITSSHDEAGLGMTVMLTLAVTDEAYRYAAGSLTVTAESGDDIDVAHTGDNPVTYTFVMPAEPVTVTAEFEQRPFHAVLPQSVTGGNLSIAGVAYNDLGEMREGSLVTVTLTLDRGWRFAAGSLEIIWYDDGDPVNVSFDGVENQTHVWTFVMPDAPVTVSAGTSDLFDIAIVDISANITLGGYAYEEGGIFQARWEDRLTISAIPRPGFRLDNARLPNALGAEDVAFTSTDVRTWTFDMPDADIVLGVNYEALGPLVVYSGGAQSGVGIDLLHGTIGDGWWGHPSEYTTLHYYGEGRGDNLRAIRFTRRPVPAGAEAAFALRSAAPLSIDANDVVALSLWARTANANVSVDFMGFGNGPQTVMVGNQPTPIPTPRVDITSDWQQFIIPVPSSMPGAFTVMDRFFLKVGSTSPALLVDNAIYFDDIEFITSDVTGQIRLPDIFDGIISLTPGTLAIDPATLIPTSDIVYTHTDGASVVLRDVQIGGMPFRNIVWDTWFGALEFRVTGDATLVNGQIIPTGLGVTFYLEASADGVNWSNPMAVNVPETLMMVLRTWEAPQTGWDNFNTATSWTFLRPGGEAVISSRSVLLAVAPRDSPVMGLAEGNIFFDAPRDISDFDFITFAIRQGRTHVGATIVGPGFDPDDNPLEDGVLRFYLRNGIGGDATWHGVEVTDLDFGTTPLVRRDPELPLSGLVDAGADLTAVTGFRFTLTRGEISVADVFAIAEASGN